MKPFLQALVLMTISFYANSQNPIKYESKIITIYTTNHISSVEPGALTFVRQARAYIANGYNVEQPRATAPPQNATVSAPAPNIIQFVLNDLNNRGFFLRSTIGQNDASGNGTIHLIFEKSTSYREAELYKLLNEVTSSIDASSKSHVEKSIATINANTLNYLKSIPNDVITQAYKDELTKVIVNNATTELKAIKEEMVKEIRALATPKP